MLFALVSVLPDVSPAGPARRDPFVPQLAPPRAASCSTDLACMRVADVHLFGTVLTPKGPLALLGTAGATFLARPGTALLDGVLVSVSAGRAVLSRFDSDGLAVPRHVEEVREVRPPR